MKSGLIVSALKRQQHFDALLRDVKHKGFFYQIIIDPLLKKHTEPFYNIIKLHVKEKGSITNISRIIDTQKSLKKCNLCLIDKEERNTSLYSTYIFNTVIMGFENIWQTLRKCLLDCKCVSSAEIFALTG